MKTRGLLLFIILFWIPSLLMGIICSGILCYGVLSPPVDPEVIAMIADRIGVEPSRDGINDYITHDAIEIGMTREEVHGVLDKIGPWGANISYPNDIIENSEIAQERKYSEIVYFIELYFPLTELAN